MEQGCCSRCFDTGRGRGACIWPVSFFSLAYNCLIIVKLWYQPLAHHPLEVCYV
jgi:hypothetical protein